MAKIADGVLHTFTTGEKIDADQAPSGGALNPIFEIIREAVNNTDGRVDELVQALVGVDANRGVFQTKVEVFTATEGQTAFTLTKGTYTVGGDRLQVYVGAAIQTVEGGNFTETSSTVFTLSEGVPAGTGVIAVWVEGLLISAEVAVHGSRHEEGGADELDVLKLKNGDQIGNLSDVVVSPDQFGTVTAGVDCSSLFTQALAKGNRVRLAAGKTYSIGNPITLSSMQKIDLNGATIQGITSIDSVFVINAPSTGSWVTDIQVNNGYFSGTMTSLVKVNGGMIAQCDFSDLEEVGTGGSITKLIRIIADTKEPSKIKVRNITAQQYQTKFIVSLESTQTGSAYSSFDGLSLGHISHWCNISGGGILNAPSNVLIHFSKFHDLYLAAQTNLVRLMNIDQFNFNTCDQIFGEFYGSNNILININTNSSENEYQHVTMYVQSESTDTGCYIFSGKATLSRFNSYAYSPFDGVFGTYKLFNFGDGSFKNYLPNYATNRTNLNGQSNHPISNYLSNPIITAAPQRVISSTGMYPIYTFNTNEMGIGDGAKIELWGRISGTGFNIMSILFDGDLFEFCQVGNSAMDGQPFKMELRITLYLDESNATKMGVYGIGTFNGVTTIKFKEYAYASSFMFKNYCSFLAAANKFYIDGCTVTPIWKSVNS